MIGIKDTNDFERIMSDSKNNSKDISTYALRMSVGCESIARIFDEDDMQKLKQNLSDLGRNLKLISRNTGMNVEFLENVKKTYESQDEEASRSVRDAI
ncbi:MAG: hypothetical protein IKJ43_00600 [Bacilli bacterium]|nr:hypothetical protein [Bacilli bacterium]